MRSLQKDGAKSAIFAAVVVVVHDGVVFLLLMLLLFEWECGRARPSFASGWCFVFVVDIFIVVVVVVFGVGVVVDSSENAGARVPLLLQAPAGANELQKPTEASISNISTTALEH